MGKYGQEIRARIKAFYERIKAGLRNEKVLEWVKALGPYVVIFTVIGGGYNELLKLRSDMDEKASARLLNTITLLDKSNSCTVRAGAVSTMGEYLRRDYTKYQDRTIQVVAYHLSEEDDSMVRIAILNLLKGAKADAIEPLASMNRVVIDKIKNGSCVDESPIKERLLKSFIRDNLSDEDSLAFDKLLAINEALVTLLKRNRHEELDLSDVLLVSSEPINLENADLRRANLKHAVLYKPDLTNTSLHRAVLEDAFVADANLEHAILRDAILVRANLASAVLRKADLTYADLSDANLCFANLEDAILERAVLPRAQLERAILINTVLRNAAMQEVDMEGAILQGANFEGANLKGANLTDANMVNATLQGADLFEADLTKANLAGADLFKADLTDANLASADLKGANLQGAILENANLDGANLGGADLENANLKAKVLFSIDSKKFQSDLDKATISKDLRQEFEDKWIRLSENTTVSIEEKDNRWLVNDKDNKQTYAVRKEEDQLNICKVTKFDPTDIKKAENWQKAIFDDYTWQKLSNQQK